MCMRYVFGGGACAHVYVSMLTHAGDGSGGQWACSHKQVTGEAVSVFLHHSQPYCFETASFTGAAVHHDYSELLLTTCHCSPDAGIITDTCGHAKLLMLVHRFKFRSSCLQSKYCYPLSIPQALQISYLARICLKKDMVHHSES